MLERKYFARQGQRYAQVTPGARYESEIQRLVERNISALFPDYVGVFTDPLFSTPAGDVQPDLILVRSDGGGWGVVEVELEGHSFRGHVLPQLAKLTHAESFPKLAELLVKELPDLPPDKIRAGLSFKPVVFLVIHGSSARHEAKLTKLGVEVRDIDVLEASNKPNEYLLAVTDRTIRRRKLDATATRSLSPTTRSIWRLADPSIGGVLTGEHKIEVEVLGTRAFWAATIEKDGVALLRQPSGLSNDLTDIDSIVRATVYVDDEHQVLYLEPAEGQV